MQRIRRCNGLNTIDDREYWCCKWDGMLYGRQQSVALCSALLIAKCACVCLCVYVCVCVCPCRLRIFSDKYVISHPHSNPDRSVAVSLGTLWASNDLRWRTAVIIVRWLEGRQSKKNTRSGTLTTSIIVLFLNYIYIYIYIRGVPGGMCQT